MSDYLSVVYDKKMRPITAYPEKLARYLYDLHEMKPGATLLEPGCGRGELLEEFRKLGLSVQGLDALQSAVEYYPSLNVKIVNIEYEGLPFSDNTFDFVFTKSVIEHFYDPEKFVLEALRVLKPGGVLITMTPDWESGYLIFYDDYTHRRPYTKVSLSYLYLAHGFSDVSVILFRQLPIVWKFPILNYLCQMIAPFVPIRSKSKLRWARNLMLIASGKK
jgi:2-polyprenyl-3-methyl-5-hydroxy-6-metoxy-1,4-benzoquinol methylase